LTSWQSERKSREQNRENERIQREVSVMVASLGGGEMPFLYPAKCRRLSEANTPMGKNVDFFLRQFHYC
jgi:hypothetical protein